MFINSWQAVYLSFHLIQNHLWPVHLRSVQKIEVVWQSYLYFWSYILIPCPWSWSTKTVQDVKAGSAPESSSWSNQVKETEKDKNKLQLITLVRCLWEKRWTWDPEGERSREGTSWHFAQEWMEGKEQWYSGEGLWFTHSKQVSIPSVAKGPLSTFKNNSWVKSQE